MFVITAGVFVVLAVFYLALWLPLAKSQKSMASSVEIWSRQLAALKPLVGSPESLGSSNTTAANCNQSLVVIVDRTVRDHRLSGALQRSQPTGNVVRVEFENAAFDDLVLWLGSLNQQCGLRVQTANFSNNSSENKGRVNSTVTLER